jgi:hypothetical protein
VLRRRIYAPYVERKTTLNNAYYVKMQVRELM